MKDWNTCFAYLNMELPDDIRRLKEAGYYNAAIARIDACLAEDWTASQNQPLHPHHQMPCFYFHLFAASHLSFLIIYVYEM